MPSEPSVHAARHGRDLALAVAAHPAQRHVERAESIEARPRVRARGRCRRPRRRRRLPPTADRRARRRARRGSRGCRRAPGRPSLQASAPRAAGSTSPARPCPGSIPRPPRASWSSRTVDPATPALLEAIRRRARRGPAEFRVLVPNPAPAEWHPFHPERHDKADAAQRVLLRALPHIQDATGVPVDGLVSIRHDPMDAIEEMLHDEPFDELIIAHRAASHRGLAARRPAHRAAHLGLPVTDGHRRPTGAGPITDPHAHLPRRPLARAGGCSTRCPEVTLFFWVIKIMCTTVGETAADYLNVNLGFGLTNTTYVAGALLAVLLVVQFRLPPLRPGRLLVGRRRDQRVRHADHRQHDRPLQRPADHEHADLRRDPRDRVRASGTPSSARCRSTRSSPRGARRSTGSRSCSRSRSAPRPATSSPRSSASATASRSPSSAA